MTGDDGGPGTWGEEEIRSVEVIYSRPFPHVTVRLAEETREYQGPEAHRLLAWLQRKKIIKSPRLTW